MVAQMKFLHLASSLCSFFSFVDVNSAIKPIATLSWEKPTKLFRY